MIKRFFCKHNWKQVTSDSSREFYGCTKCGETHRLFKPYSKVWKFERRHKGETFE